MKNFLFITIIAVSFIYFSGCDAADDTEQLYEVGRYRLNWSEGLKINLSVIRYPAESNGHGTPKISTGETFPGIAVINGGGGAEWNISWIAKLLTSYGYITICITPPNPFSGDNTHWAISLNEGLEKLKEQNDLPDSYMSGLLDVETLGVIGFSMGGGGSLEASYANPEIDAIVALAPSDQADVFEAAQNIAVPIQLQAGSVDGIVSADSVYNLYNMLPDTITTEYIEIEGANHIGTLDIWVAQIAQLLGIDKKIEISFKEQHRVSSKYFLAWFQYFLKDLNEYESHIFGDDARDDLLSEFEYNRP